jgi:hypothetical protein
MSNSRLLHILALSTLAACAGPPSVTQCAKVLCDPGEYCLSVEGDTAEAGEPFPLPDCTAPPAACGDRATCGCLTDCLECTESAQGVFCTVAAD